MNIASYQQPLLSLSCGNESALNFNPAVEDLCLRRAVRWLLSSKIRNSDKRCPHIYGSLNNYYSVLFRKCPFAYTEITAYAVELLLYLHSWYQDPRMLQYAVDGGRWLLSMQCRMGKPDCDGGFHQNYVLGERNGSMQLFSFDTGICVGALVDLAFVVGDQLYLKAAVKGAEWLLNRMLNDDGPPKVGYDIAKQSFLDHQQRSFTQRLSVSRRWYLSPGCYHGKVAIGLLKLYNVTEDAKLRDAAEKLCEWTIAQQRGDGGFRVNVNDGVVFTHAHNYALEGLLYSYGVLEEEQLLKAVRKGAEWLILKQNASGSLPDRPDAPFNFTSDISAVAQAARIWWVLYQMLGEDRFMVAARKALTFLQRAQAYESDEDVDGGFPLLTFDLGFKLLSIPRYYSWATIFAIHALALSKQSSCDSNLLW